MLSLSDNIQADVNEACNITSRYQVELLNTDNRYFQQMVSWIYPKKHQLNKTNNLLMPHFWAWTCPVSSTINVKRGDFNSELVNFHFLDGDNPRSPSYGI